MSRSVDHYCERNRPCIETNGKRNYGKTMCHIRIRECRAKHREKPWTFECDVAYPCATENELNGEDATRLVTNGCQMVTEGANMPCTEDAIDMFSNEGIQFIPSKLANAGGVIVSCLEMSQNANLRYMTETQVDRILMARMQTMFDNVTKVSNTYDCSFKDSVNIAAFLPLAESLKRQGFI